MNCRRVYRMYIRIREKEEDLTIRENILFRERVEDEIIRSNHGLPVYEEDIRWLIRFCNIIRVDMDILYRNNKVKVLNEINYYGENIINILNYEYE